MTPSASRVRWRACLLVVLALGAAILLAGVYLWQYLDYTGPTLAQAPPQTAPSAQPAYTLSSEQQDLVDEIGYPDSFTLLFYQGLDGQDQFYDIRFESWHYTDVGRQIAFINGEAVSEEAVETGDAVSPTPYRPEQFAASMRLEDMLAATGVSEYARAAADPVLVAGGEVYFARQLAFGLKAGHVIAVETMPLEAEG